MAQSGWEEHQRICIPAQTLQKQYTDYFAPQMDVESEEASAQMWFHGIFLQTVGPLRSQNNWTEPSSCYLLAQWAVVWCHSLPPPLALAHSPRWVVEFLCWRNRLIDNSICVGVITAWLIGRGGTLEHCHYWHTGTTPHALADGRGNEGMESWERPASVWTPTCLCVEKWVEEKWREGSKERPVRLSCG